MEDELRGIGDMARASGLSVSALRFYDRVGLLMPAAVDPVTGYRRYSADQLGVATLVAGMRRIGMPLAEITTVLEQRGDPAVAGRVLDEHLSRLEDALADARREAQRLRGMVSSGPTVPSTWPTTVASVDVDALELARAMDSVRFAVSDDPGVPELSGVLIEIQDSTVRLVATDRYRLASYEVSARRRTGDRTSAVVPARLLDEARALLDGRGDATIDLSGERITITAGNGQAGSGCLEDAFPDHRRILGSYATESRFVVDAAELRTQVQAGVAHPIRRERDGVTTHVVVLVVPPGGELTVAMSAQPDGQPSVAVDRRFLLEAIDAGAEAQLALELGGPLSPIAVRVPDNERFVSLVMPVRL